MRSAWCAQASDHRGRETESPIFKRSSYSEWEKQVTAPLDGLFPAATRHLLLANHRAVKLNPHSVILEPVMEIEFEYAIIATVNLFLDPV